MGFSLRCPICRGKFPWPDPTKGFPETCELCGEHIGHDRDDEDIVVPFIRTNAKMKAVDDVYRQMEAGSIHRSQLAAQALGVPEADMSALKITNLNDSQRAGDVAAKMPANPVSELMQAFPNQTGYNNLAGIQYSQGTKSGPNPNAGIRTTQSITQRFHSNSPNVHAEGRTR